MSSNKIIIDSKSKVDVQQTTTDLYKELDVYVHMSKEDDKRHRRTIAREIDAVGEDMLKEIDQKHEEREKKRIQMIEYIHKYSKDKFITLKEVNTLPFEDLVPIYEQVSEFKKPWWRKLINIFVD